MEKFGEQIVEPQTIEIEKDEDFRDEAVIERILESGSEEKMKELADFHGWTPEQLKLGGDFAKQRKRTIEAMDAEMGKRIKENPIASKEELSAGRYKEDIEPQVRDAVFNMRRKGYDTYESGFYGPGNQKIGFKNEVLMGFQLPKNLVDELKAKNINITIEPDSIFLTLNQYFELNEIKEIWDKIERVLPNLDKLAEPNNIPAAESFREKQEKLKADLDS